LCRAYLLFRILGVRLTFSRTVWATLNGVCMVFIVSQRKAHSTLHPRRARRELHLIGWSYCGVILFAAKYLKACSCDINVAYI